MLSAFEFLSPLPVPPPTVTITANSDRTLYNGEDVILTCTITLDPAVDDAVFVTISWTGPSGGMLGSRRVADTDTYVSSITLDSLTTSDAGQYTCTASICLYEALACITCSDSGIDSHSIAVGKASVSLSVEHYPLPYSCPISNICIISTL